MSRLRCLFYTMSVVSEKRRACVDGFVGIEIVSELGFEQSKGHFFELVEKALPVHMKALHLVHIPPTTIWTNQFFGTLKLLGVTAYRRARVHTGKSKEKILEKLKACGLFSEGLPEYVGGTWTNDNFVEWQTERRRVEEEIHLMLDVCEQKSQDPTSLSPIPKKPVGSSFIDVAPTEGGKEIKPQKRKMEIFYSRTKRERQRLNLQTLRDESTRLTLRNTELKQDNDCLERSLASAEAVIARIELLGPRTIPGCVRGTQHPTPLGLSTSRGGAYAQQLPFGLSTSQGMTYEEQTPLGLSTRSASGLSTSQGMTYEQQTPSVLSTRSGSGLSTSQGMTYEQQTPLGLSTSSGMAYAQHPLPGSSSFGNIGAGLGLQRSIEEQQFLRHLVREMRSPDSLLIGRQHDAVADRAALLARQLIQQHGQLQSPDFAASISLPQATASAPGTFYPAGFSSAIGASRLPVAQSSPPVGYASQNAPQAPLDQHQNHYLRRWLQQQFQNLPGAPPGFGQPPP
jgi:hypothetical protein